MIVIPDIFQSVVTSTEAAWGEDVHFLHGHMLEITNITKQLAKDADVTKRYPLIALRHDIKQSKLPYKGVEFDCTLFIITLSRPEYTAEERIETIYKPILYPLKEEFISQIARSGYFEQQSIEDVEEKTTWYDRLFWGSSTVMGNTANIFGDWVDCIEIEFSGLVALNNCNIAITDHAPRLQSAIAGATGEYIYLTFSEEMNDPALFYNQCSVWSNGFELEPISVTRSLNKRLYIVHINPNGYPFVDSGVLDIESGFIESENGVPLATVRQYPIQSALI